MVHKSDHKIEKVNLLVFRNVNRPFTLMGFPPGVFAATMFALLLTAIVNVYVAASLFITIILLTAFVQKENKRGYPNYLRGLYQFFFLRKKYADREGYLKYLLRNEVSRSKEN